MGGGKTSSTKKGNRDEKVKGAKPQCFAPQCTRPARETLQSAGRRAGRIGACGRGGARAAGTLGTNSLGRHPASRLRSGAGGIMDRTSTAAASHSRGLAVPRLCFSLGLFGIGDGSSNARTRAPRPGVPLPLLSARFAPPRPLFFAVPRSRHRGPRRLRWAGGRPRAPPLLHEAPERLRIAAETQAPPPPPPPSASAPAGRPSGEEAAGAQKPDPAPRRAPEAPRPRSPNTRHPRTRTRTPSTAASRPSVLLRTPAST